MEGSINSQDHPNFLCCNKQEKEQYNNNNVKVNKPIL